MTEFIAIVIVIISIAITIALWSMVIKKFNKRRNIREIPRVKNNEIESKSHIKNKVIIKTYKGNQAQAIAAFQADAVKMAAQGYYPTSQTWAPGSYGCGSFLIALLLCFIIVGFLVFIYMLIVKPDGTLTVTYELRSASEISVSETLIEEKTCPKCAEKVKAAALICRYCGHSFE